jgi:predicted dehydrogenase
LIGVSGYGQIHFEFLEELRRTGAIALVAATVINPVEVPATVASLRSAGCQIYEDYRQMLARMAGTIDLCCVPTGIPLHAPMTIAALEAGANVLVEKPMAATLEEVKQMIEASERAGRFVAVGFQDITVAENLALKQALMDGKIGRLRRIRGRGMWPRDTGYYRRNAWAGRRKIESAWVLDSPLSNAFSHFLNLSLFFAGPEKESSAIADTVEAELFRAQPIENFDTAALRLTTRDGVQILFYVTHSCSKAVDPELIFEGEGGRVVWRHGRDIRIESADGTKTVVPLPDDTAVRRTMFRSVIEKLSRPENFVCGPSVAAEHTRVCEMAQESTVRDIPADWLKRASSDRENGERIVIRDIEKWTDKAFDSGLLFSEIGCPWSHPAEKLVPTPIP